MQILVTTHGDLAQGICSTLNMFFGEAEIAYICLDAAGSERFSQKLESYLTHVQDNIIVLCDLQGGTPYNQAVRLRETLNMKERIGIVAGVNLPMLLQLYTLKDEVTLKEAMALCEEAGKNGVAQYVPAVFVEDDNF